MKNILFILGVAMIACTAFAKDGAKTVKVFILAGQSNMVGHGKVEYGRNPDYDKNDKKTHREVKGGIGGLRCLVTNPETKARYKHLVDSDGNWVVREDVWIYSTTPGKDKGKLTVGFGKGSWFGPELGFGHVLGDHVKGPVLIIKAAWGGKDLAVDFRPPSSGSTDLGQGKREPGVYYKKIMDMVKKVLANYEKDFPELKGYKAEIAGFGWHQGWNDGCNEDATAEYEENMANFIRDVRKDLGVQDLPFVIANTGMNGLETKGTFAELCEAQMAIGNPAKHPEFKGTVKSIDTRPFKAPDERAPSGFGYHWNHSGESHYLVGDAMGRAMVELLSGVFLGDVPTPVKPSVTDRLQLLPPGSIKLSGFIQKRIQQQSEYMFNEQFLAEMVDKIRMQPHRLVNGKPTGLAEGEFWGKAVRALSRYYQYSGDPRLRETLETTVADIMSIQTSEGSISDTHPDLQPYHSDIWDRKYTLLGLINAYESTGDEKVLESAMSLADHTLSMVGPAPKVRIVHTSFNSSPTNPDGWFFGIESSSILEPIMRLYLLTGKEEYLEFARYIVEDEGCTSTGNLFEEILEGKDASELVNGRACHAYSITSCFEGLMDYYRVTGNKKWEKAAMKLYENILDKELAVIGTYCGLGPGGNENFCHTALYQAFSKRQGLEACSAPRWMAFCRHLLCTTGESKFADEYERSLYNAVLGSIRPDGRSVDYFTHLTGTRPDMRRNFRREFAHESFTCCSYNVAETLANVPFSTIMKSEGGLVINLYIPGTANVKLAGGNEVTIKQTTDYPKTGKVTIDVNPLKQAKFPIRMRIPKWSKQTTVMVNGSEQVAKPGSYLVLNRQWKTGDRIILSLDMRCRLVRSPEGSPKEADRFRALVRGPIVLARDKRLGGNIYEPVTIQADAEGYVAVKPEAATIPSLMQFSVPVAGGSISVVDFATSGNTWDERSERVTWIPQVSP